MLLLDKIKTFERLLESIRLFYLLYVHLENLIEDDKT